MYIVKYENKLLDNLKKARIVALDTETKSLEDRTLVGFSVAYGQNEKFYVPIRDKYLDNMPVTKAKNLLNNILQNCHVIFHNSSFDLPVLYSFGVIIPDKDYDDTVIMANLVNENMQHGLKSLVKKYFNYQMIEFKELTGTGKNYTSFDELKDEKKVQYACDDAEWTLKLYHVLKEEIDKDKHIANVYYNIEKPLLKVVAQMHIHGVRINISKVMEVASICQQEINFAEEKLRILMGKDINFNSSKQLREYFISKCHMPVIRKSSKTNQPSVDKEVLEVYAETNSEAKLLLEYRKYSKIHSTFISALTPTNWDTEDQTGYIYASFNQAGTVSGRFSSSKPNMQNIPHDDDLGLREVVIPDKGEILIGADYSQIELRVLAHFSKDPNLLLAYNNKKDIHQQTADALKIDRYDAKTINFGLVYGMGAKTLAKKIKKSYDDATYYLEKFFQVYYKVKEFWNTAEQQFRNYGYVQTISGRKRRRTPYFFAKEEYDQGAEVRSAINSIIQGTAADLMKRAMVSMYPQLKKYGAHLILTVHDEVLVSCPVDKAKQVYGVIHRAMVSAGNDLDVLVEVDAKFGRTWQEAHSDQLPELKKELEEIINAKSK